MLLLLTGLLFIISSSVLFPSVFRRPNLPLKQFIPPFVDNINMTQHSRTEMTLDSVLHLFEKKESYKSLIHKDGFQNGLNSFWMNDFENFFYKIYVPWVQRSLQSVLFLSPAIDLHTLKYSSITVWFQYEIECNI